MTQIDTDVDPVVNVAARFCYETRRAEGVIEYPTESARDHYDIEEDEVESVAVAIEAKRNQFDSLVLEAYAWHGCNVTQHYDVSRALDKKFDELVERHDLEEVEEFSDVEDLIQANEAREEDPA